MLALGTLAVSFGMSGLAQRAPAAGAGGWCRGVQIERRQVGVGDARGRGHLGTRQVHAAPATAVAAAHCVVVAHGPQQGVRLVIVVVRVDETRVVEAARVRGQA